MEKFLPTAEKIRELETWRTDDWIDYPIVEWPGWKKQGIYQLDKQKDGWNVLGYLLYFDDDGIRTVTKIAGTKKSCREMLRCIGPVEFHGVGNRWKRGRRSVLAPNAFRVEENVI